MTLVVRQPNHISSRQRWHVKASPFGQYNTQFPNHKHDKPSLKVADGQTDTYESEQKTRQENVILEPSVVFLLLLLAFSFPSTPFHFHLPPFICISRLFSFNLIESCFSFLFGISTPLHPAHPLVIVSLQAYTHRTSLPT